MDDFQEYAPQFQVGYMEIRISSEDLDTMYESASGERREILLWCNKKTQENQESRKRKQSGAKNFKD